MKKIMQAIHPDDEAHLQKMGLKKDEIMQWEDGMRTSGKKGTYEWWFMAEFNIGDVVTDINTEQTGYSLCRWNRQGFYSFLYVQRQIKI